MQKQFLFLIFFATGFCSFSQFAPLVTVTVTGNPSHCVYTPGTYSIAPVTGATSYMWSFPFSWTGTSTTNVISVIPNLISGTISVTSTNSNGQIINGRMPVNVVDCNNGISRFGLSGFNGVIEAYPNSGYGRFYVDYNGDNTSLGVSVTNILGEEIYNRNLQPDSKNLVNLSGKKGMFFLKVFHISNYIVVMKKIIVLE